MVLGSVVYCDVPLVLLRLLWVLTNQIELKFQVPRNLYGQRKTFDMWKGDQSSVWFLVHTSLSISGGSRKEKSEKMGVEIHWRTTTVHQSHQETTTVQNGQESLLQVWLGKEEEHQSSQKIPRKEKADCCFAKRDAKSHPPLSRTGFLVSFMSAQQ